MGFDVRGDARMSFMREALLLTGLFGAGKSTILADMAEMLERSPTLHAASASRCC